MANTFTSYELDRIFAMALLYLRRKTAVMSYVTKEPLEAALMPARKGQDIIITLDEAEGEDATDVIPGPTPPTPTGRELKTAKVSLNQYKKRNFALTDQEATQLREGTLTTLMQACLDGLARTIVKYVFRQMRLEFYHHVGTAGTTPFASDTTVAKQARVLLDNARCPLENRYMILDFDADANAASLDILRRLDARGDFAGLTLQEGRVIGRALGFDWDSDGYIPTHTRLLANSSADLAINGAVLAGATTCNMDGTSVTGTLNEGDVFRVANVDGYFVVEATATAAGNALTGVSFYPPAPAGGFANDAAVTLAGTVNVPYKTSFAFHRSAVCFASRRLDDAEIMIGGSEIRTEVDPVTGIWYQMEIQRQYAQTMFEMRALYGCTVPESRRGLGVKVLG